MKKFTYAVTHPGNAHLDDVLTSALLFGSGAVKTIFREEPNKADLLSTDIIVFDAGRSFNIDFDNYDHHQDNNLPCALYLVAKHILGWENPEEVFPWWETVDIRDRLGYRNMLKHFGADSNLVGKLKDPIGAGIIKLFGEERVIRLDSTLGRILQFIGQDLITVYNKFHSDWNKLQYEYIDCEVGAEKILISTEPGNTALFARAEKENIRIVQQPNQRGTGVTLTRVTDAPGVDFSKVHDNIMVSFVHSNGFMCVVEDEKFVPDVIRQAL